MRAILTGVRCQLCSHGGSAAAAGATGTTEGRVEEEEILFFSFSGIKSSSDWLN